jgi:sugar O-acyltransferase (sialic acid O-acetyltransferase NeuD family)
VTTLYLCGAGNSEGVRLALRRNEFDRQWDRIVLLDDDVAKHGTQLLGVTIEGAISLLGSAPSGSFATNLVARRTVARAAVHRRIEQSGVPFASIVHPAVDARDCELGAGVLVYEQAILSPETRLGDGSCVLMRGIVGHGTTVGACCVIAPGAVLNARVVLEDRAYVGSNASVLPELRVGADATIGANTMVAQDVPPGATVVGVPGIVLASAPVSSPIPDASSVASADFGAVVPAGVLDLEGRLLEVLYSVLGHGRAGPTDHFFDVGGTSLRAIQFVEAVRSVTGHEVPLPVFYARSTMRELASHLAGSGGSSAAQAARERALLRRRMTGFGSR